jgi:hypothetical protein
MKKIVAKVLALAIVFSGFVATIPASATGPVPATPGAPSATAGNRQVALTWNAAFDNGSPIVSYTAISNPEGKTCTTSGLSCTITGLTNEVSYTFRLIATNENGSSLESAASVAVRPTHPTQITDSFTFSSPSFKSLIIDNAGSFAYILSSNGQFGRVEKFSLTSRSVVATVELPRGIGFPIEPTSTQLNAAEFNQVSALSPEGDFLYLGGSTFPGVIKLRTSDLSLVATGTMSQGGGIRTLAVAKDTGKVFATANYRYRDSNGIYTGYTMSAIARFGSGLSQEAIGTGYKELMYSALDSRGEYGYFFEMYWGLYYGGAYPSVRRVRLSDLTEVGYATLNNYRVSNVTRMVVDEATQKLYVAGNLYPKISSVAVSRFEIGTTRSLKKEADYQYSNRRAEFMVSGSNKQMFLFSESDKENWGHARVNLEPWGSVSRTNWTVDGGFSNPRYSILTADEKQVIASNYESGQVKFVMFSVAEVPGPVVVSSALFGDSTANLSWSEPVGVPPGFVTGYQVQDEFGNTVCEVISTSCVVSGLTNGNAYRFKVRATSENGFGPNGPLSSTVIPAAVPQPPAEVLVSEGNESVSLTWVMGDNGGSSILETRATVSPGSLTCASSGNSCSVSGLTNGVEYSVTLASRNKAGFGSESATQFEFVPRTVPGSPESVSVTYGNESASVSWEAPLDDGGSPVSGYQVRTIPSGGSCDVGPGVLSCQLSGLTNGTSYVAIVSALNEAGAGAASSSTSFIPKTTPSPVSSLNASAGNESVTLRWTAPDNGGASISGFTVTSTPEGHGCQTSGTTCQVTGLTNGDEYSFSITATNSEGSSAPTSSASVIPAALPSGPTSVAASLTGNSVAISWQAPSSDGGQPVTGYKVTALPSTPFVSQKTCETTTALTCSISGLNWGVGYTFLVQAKNVQGFGESSASKTLKPLAVPGSPTNISAIRGNSEVTVSWTAPSFTGGAAITNYTVTSTQGDFTCSPNSSTVRTCKVTGLENGNFYNFTVVATNSQGDSLPSVPSTYVVPATVPDLPEDITVTPGNGTLTISWTPPTEDGGSAITGYRLYLSPPGTYFTISSSSRSYTLYRTNGVNYSFRLQARSSVGYGLLSEPIVEYPSTVPTLPRNAQALAGDGEATVSWTAPFSSGGAAITEYVVRDDSGTDVCSIQAPFTELACTISGLNNGTQVKFQTIARNRSGDSPSSLWTSLVTPAGLPAAPQNVSASATGSAISVSWDEGDMNGASLRDYEAIASFSGQEIASCQSVATSCTILNLPAGKTYSVSVEATNSIGTSPASAAVQVQVAFAPMPPQNLIAVSSDERVDLYWNEPESDGGDPSITYQIDLESADVYFNTTDLSRALINLENGVEQRVRLRAGNSAGFSEWTDWVTFVSWPIPDTFGGQVLQGTVTRLGTGQAVAGQRIAVSFDYLAADNEEYVVTVLAYSDASGNYAFDDLPNAATLTLSIGGDGTGFTSRSIEFPGPTGNQTKTKDVRLRYLGALDGLIAGNLLGWDGEPLADTRVTLTLDQDAAFSRELSTDAEGFFEFTNLPLGDFNIAAYPTSLIASRAVYPSGSEEEFLITLDAQNSEQTNLNLVLEPYDFGLGSISGEVKIKGSSIPVPDVSVYLTPLVDLRLSSITTSTTAQGEYLFDALPDGIYKLEFNSSGSGRYRNPEAQTITVSNGSSVQGDLAEVEFLGQGAGSATISVRSDTNNLPLPGVTVTLTLEGVNDASYSATTGENGRAEFRNLLSGDYLVATDKDGHLPSTRNQSFTLESGLIFSSFTMKPLVLAGKISGSVKTQIGNNPIEDVFVFASYDFYDGCCGGGDQGPWELTSASGQFSLEGIPLGLPVTLIIGVDSYANALGYKEITRSIVLTEDSPELNLDFLVASSASLKGTILGAAGQSTGNLEVVALEPETLRSMGRAEVSRTGLYEFDALLPGTYVFALVDERLSGLGTTETALGYLRRVSDTRSIIVPDYDWASIVTLSSNSVFSLGTTDATTGSTIRGQFALSNGDGREVPLNRESSLVLMSWDGARWTEYSAARSIFIQNPEMGNFVVRGIPAGTYRVGIQDNSESANTFGRVYFGGPEFESATSFVLGSGSDLAIGKLVFELPRPTSAPAQFSLTSLSEGTLQGLQDLIQAIETPTQIKVSVGKEHAGEWVTAVFTASAPLSVQSLRALSHEFHAATSPNWYQVDANGEIAVAKSQVTGNRLLVQDARSNILGWTTLNVVSVTTPPPSPGGSSGGGGGGGFFFPPTITASPALTTNPIPAGQRLGAVDADGNAISIAPALAQDKKSIELSFGGAKLSLAAPTGASFSEDGKLSITPASSMTISATGYQPDSTVTGYLVPMANLVAAGFRLAAETTVELGTATVSQNGSFNFDAKISANPGSYLLQLTGTTSDGKQTTIALETLIASQDQSMKTWAKRMTGNLEAKLYAKNIIGAGKVSFRVNGKEIAWIRAVDATDPKLRVVTEGPMTGANYLVRTVKLQKGKNVLEVYIDGERTTRVSYSRK